MSRATSGETIVVKPSSDVYTVLVVVATLVVVIGLIVLFIRSNALGMNLI